MLLDNILTRLTKLEGKIDFVANSSSTNNSHAAGGIQALAPVSLQKPIKRNSPGSPAGTSRLRPHVRNRL